jgi:hypothetical protein
MADAIALKTVVTMAVTSRSRRLGFAAAISAMSLDLVKARPCDAFAAMTDWIGPVNSPRFWTPPQNTHRKAKGPFASIGFRDVGAEHRPGPVPSALNVGVKTLQITFQVLLILLHRHASRSTS